MDLARPTTIPQSFLTLKEAAQKLSVSVETLLEWNDVNILKPTITPTGEVGYRQEQVEQFLAIREFSQRPLASKQPVKTSRLAFYSALAVGVTGLSVLVFVASSQQGRLISFLSHSEQTYFAFLSEKKTTNQEASSLPVSGNYVLNTAQNSSKGGSLQIPGENNALSSAFTPKKVAKAPTSSTQNSKVLAASTAIKSAQTWEKLASTASAQVTAVSDTINHVGTLADTAQFADKTAPAGVFDSNSNITGAHAFGPMAMALGTPVSIADTPAYQQQDNQDLRNQILLLVMGCCVVALLLKKQTTRPLPAQAQAPAVTPSRKVLEIGQKMDGTVVLYIQGQEHKISKPELSSDSDRFFERLMELVPFGVKEIEYDSLSDNVHLSTPLSRLVTRLGFVGIKRDLFFPRTSKNRVLFRKYLTQEDLLAMNMTVEDLSTKLLQEG